MIERFLDQFEKKMADQYGHLMYALGPFSRWGSVFNAVVSGLFVVAGVIALVTVLQPFLLVVGAALHAFFVLIALRVYNGRTLYDRELQAQLEAEEAGRIE